MISRRTLLAIPAAAALPALATPDAPVEGKEYTVVRPAVPVQGGKIEVVDFFAYTCSHCIRFAPVVEKWAKTLPDWVAYKQIPVAWGTRTDPFVKAYYAMRALGVLEDLHMKFFESVIYQTHPYEDYERDIASFMVKSGVDGKAWVSAYNSFATSNLARAARRAWQSYGLDATPMVGIHGKYLTGPHMSASMNDSIKTIETLIGKVKAGL